MKKPKRLTWGHRPWGIGLVLLLGLGSGCGETNGIAVDTPSQQPEVAVAQQTDEGLEELPAEILARAANVYPATIRQEAVGNCSPVGVLSAGGCPGLDVRRGES